MVQRGVKEYVVDQQLNLPDRINFKVGVKTNVQTATSTMAVPGGTKIMEVITETIEYMPKEMQKQHEIVRVVEQSPPKR